MERFVFHVTADNEFRIVDTSDDGKNYLFDDVDTILKLLNDAQATIAALQADNRTYINERHEHVKQIEQLQSQLTQRTAELERVRGERDEYAHKTKMLCLQNGPLMIENHDMKKLIAALPKVDGEIEVSSGVYNFILLKHDSGTRFLCGQIETEQTAKAYAALLKHRQGMEG